MPPDADAVVLSQPKALIFDFIGTCTNWHASVLSALQSAPAQEKKLPREKLSQFALDWRTGFFRETAIRAQSGQGPEDIDVTHRRVLNFLLGERGISPSDWDDTVRKSLIASWHTQEAWPDTLPGLERLRKKYFVVVLGNGSTRYQLDVCKSANLPFHTLFSSELLGKNKPDPTIYHKALSLLQIEASQAVMVAAHAYDLRAAKSGGMKTVYVQRDTEDVDEDMQALKLQFDFFLDGTQKDNKQCGMEDLADIFGA